MHITRREALALGAATLLPTAQSLAQSAWPAKPIRFLVPFAPGGTSEIVARSVAAELTKQLGQNVFVENKPGGAGVIAMQEVAKAPADGHTIILGHVGTLAVNPYMLNNQPYDVNRDFIPVTLLAKVPNVFVVHPDVPAKNFKEFVEYAKKNPGKLNYGSTGSGSSNHLSTELLMSMTGIKLTHVPYKGSAPAVAALMAGEIDVLFDNIPNIIGQIKAGTVTAIAVTGLKPSSLLPGIPTVSESGAPGFEVNVWFGMQVPAATPKAVVAQINRQLAAIFREPDITKRFTDAGVEVVASTPEEFSALLESEVAKWGKVVQDANIKIE